MPSRAHTIWNIQATLTLPILWSFTALLLAMIIPPPSLNTQLQPVYHHSPRADIDATGAGRTALILTAHPDDEAMFFSPTIMGLKNHGWEVRGLCLSTGNAEGLGAERVEELKRSYGVFGVQESHVKWLNDSLVDMFNNTAQLIIRSFPDNMGAVWRSEDVQRAVGDYLSDQPADVVSCFCLSFVPG
jgi:N-acetylglucosaminylphosphatidylinositol deacetylase